ncbi:MAG: DUF5723 family protein [Chitinophagales bacterium]|nr:DUF5723 family protein [Chitinophagales bacterium]
MKKITFLLASLCLAWQMNAQNNLGHNTDNYNGVHALTYNPAEIVDSRFKFHMNIISVGTTVSNNFAAVKRSALFKDRDVAFNDNNFQDNWMVERLNGRTKGAYVSGDIGYLPSFMINVGKDKKYAFGLNLRTRFQVNANGVDENLATMSFHGLDLASLYNVGIQNKNFSLQTNVWNEYGIAFGMPIINKGKTFISVAGTAKLTQGIADAYFYSKNLDVTFPNDSMVSVNNTDFNFGYSTVMGPDFQNMNFKTFMNGGGFGVGFDLGAVWEFRPNTEKYQMEMDGETILDPKKEKYKFKVGFSVMDLGYTSYKRSNGVNADFYANRSNIDIDETFGAAFEDFENTGLQNFKDTLESLFVVTQAEKEGYKVSLPTRINAYIDYNIWKGFYANLGASISPGFVRNPEKTRGISEFSISPRFEHKWFSFYLPLSVNSHGNFHMGTGFRAGPLALGTNDILVLAKKNIYDANFYASLSIPITKKIKDKDKDKVSNKKDDCKKEPGLWATKGCPDTDKDKDGISDTEDDCPTVKGLAEFNGCPDTDGDGIMDKEDDCPEVAGLKEFNGCPDTDGDGIIDSKDECPEMAGLEQYNGCPDTDSDGLADNKDNCPEVAGPKENNGCPFADEDKDGVPDKDDKCPKTPGLKENNGCPKIEKEVEEALDLAFKNLEFETGKAVIKKTSYTSLETLVQILNTHPTYKLLVEGHTDSVGSEESNQKLSEERAAAVKTFLTGKGVKADQIITRGYGETKP